MFCVFCSNFCYICAFFPGNIGGRWRVVLQMNLLSGHKGEAELSRKVEINFRCVVLMGVGAFSVLAE